MATKLFFKNSNIPPFLYMKKLLFEKEKSNKTNLSTKNWTQYRIPLSFFVLSIRKSTNDTCQIWQLSSEYEICSNLLSQAGLSLHPPLPPPPTNPRSEFEVARHRLEIQRPRLDLERPALERRLHQERLERLSTNEGQRWLVLGKPSFKKSAVFFNIVQKAFDSPTRPFVWTLCGEFFWRNFNKSA